MKKSLNVTVKEFRSFRVAATPLGLRDLFQYSLRPVARSPIIPQLDSFQALGIKRYSLCGRVR
jgi:hypothetical protein